MNRCLGSLVRRICNNPALVTMCGDVYVCAFGVCVCVSVQVGIFCNCNHSKPTKVIILHSQPHMYCKTTKEHYHLHEAKDTTSLEKNSSTNYMKLTTLLSVCIKM